MCVCVCVVCFILYVHVSVAYVKCPYRSEDGIRSHRARVTASCESSDGGLDKQHALLTAKPSLLC